MKTRRTEQEVKIYLQFTYERSAALNNKLKQSLKSIFHQKIGEKHQKFTLTGSCFQFVLEFLLAHVVRAFTEVVHDNGLARQFAHP